MIDELNEDRVTYEEFTNTVNDIIKNDDLEKRLSKLHKDLINSKIEFGLPVDEWAAYLCGALDALNGKDALIARYMIIKKKFEENK